MPSVLHSNSGSDDKMKIYLAGTVILVERERKNIKLYKHRLFSYIYIIPNRIENNVFEFVIQKINKKNKENIK